MQSAVEGGWPAFPMRQLFKSDFSNYPHLHGRLARLKIRLLYGRSASFRRYAHRHFRGDLGLRSLARFEFERLEHRI